jgi:hypothetical protein
MNLVFPSKVFVLGPQLQVSQLLKILSCSLTDGHGSDALSGNLSVSTRCDSCGSSVAIVAWSVQLYIVLLTAV